MTVNISGFGLQARVKASTTFPEGVTITQFADDQDPVDNPELIIAESGMGLNGDHVVWSKATPLDLTFAVIPESDDDINLTILHDANRVAKGKRGARDSIDITLNYPSGRIITFTGGIVISGSAATSTASSGRFKTKTFKFRFEGLSRSGD